jgi:magnesium chelatase family protein
VELEDLLRQQAPPVDFAEVRGQEAAKRAATIAAGGNHNMLMLGPAGTGKTTIAQAFPGILPPLSREEALEVTRIYSTIGQVPKGEPLIAHRPVRMPHHSASSAAVIGGGAIPRPGEASLAHHGVLFLDELPEFPRTVLETLRQPLEDGQVTIARAQSSIRFPARFLFLAAMNPTPKGHTPTDEAGQKQMERYLDRISGPLIDRVDLHVEVPQVPYQELANRRDGTDSATMRHQVEQARQIQRRRNGGPLSPNATLSTKMLDELAPIEPGGEALLKQAMSELGLSARAYDKIRRIARTIADLSEAEPIGTDHVAEAIQYRSLDRQL